MAGTKRAKAACIYHCSGDRPFAFAGLWETWQEDYRSFTIITCPASDGLRAIHDRMTAVLDPAAYEIWLDTVHHETDDALAILKEQTQTDFVFWPVSRQVNSVKVNDPSNIEPTH